MINIIIKSVILSFFICFTEAEEISENKNNKHFCLYYKQEKSCAMVVFAKDSVPEIFYFNDGKTKLYITQEVSNYPNVKLENLFVILQLNPIKISWNILTMGPACLIKRGEDIIKVEGISGVKINNHGESLISFWCDDTKILPNKSDDIENFEQKYWDILLKSGQVSFHLPTTSKSGNNLNGQVIP